MMLIAWEIVLEHLSFGVDGLGSVSRNTSTGNGSGNSSKLGPCLRCHKLPEQLGGSDYWVYRMIITQRNGQAIESDAREIDLSTSHALFSI